MFWNCNLFNLLLNAIIIMVAVPESMSQSEQPRDHVFKSWGTSKIQIEKLRYIWTIENFSLHDKENGEELTSTTFSSNNNCAENSYTGGKKCCQWNLNVYPNGFRENSKDYVSLYLTLQSCSIKAKYKLGILNAKGVEVNIKKNSYERIARDESLGYEQFIKREFVLNEENNVLSDDKLIIFCEINVITGVEKISLEFKPQPLPNGQLGKDLAFLLQNRNFSNVMVISSGAQEFPALSAILAARSPVFKSMFENFENKELPRVEMTDVEPEVVKELLRYIYTDVVVNLKVLAPKLLAVAVKYELDGLEALCAISMSENLTVENSAEFYSLGDTYSAVDLKIRAKDFIVAHSSAVANSQGFKAMIETHPHLVREVFSALSDQLALSCNIE